MVHKLIIFSSPKIKEKDKGNGSWVNIMSMRKINNPWPHKIKGKDKRIMGQGYRNSWRAQERKGRKEERPARQLPKARTIQRLLQRYERKERQKPGSRWQVHDSFDCEVDPLSRRFIKKLAYYCWSISNSSFYFYSSFLFGGVTRLLFQYLWIYFHLSNLGSIKI